MSWACWWIISPKDSISLMNDACMNGSRLAGATALSMYVGVRCNIMSPALNFCPQNSHSSVEVLRTHDTPHSISIWRGNHQRCAGSTNFLRFIIGAGFEGIQGTKVTITDTSVWGRCPHTSPMLPQWRPYQQRTQEPSGIMQNSGFRRDMRVTNSSGGTIFGGIFW